MKAVGKNNFSGHISYEQNLRPYHEKIAEFVCQFSRDDALILDIGCGVGHTLSEIRRRKPGLRLVAADIDQKCLELTGEKVELEEALHINGHEDLADAKRMYDGIIMSHILEHTHNPLDVVGQVMDLLAPGGFLFLAVPNPVRPTVILKSVRRKHYVNPGHVYAWDRSHFMNFLENIPSLDVVCYSQDYFPVPFVGKWRLLYPLEIWLAKIFPWFAFSHIAVVRKSPEAS